jgi:hypothetical protein
VPPSTSPPKDRDERGNKGGRSDEAHRDRDERRKSVRDEDED